MILNQDELKWIHNRMDLYEIKYREIYDEIADHIITAIEEKRKAGDTDEIKYLFKEVVDTHFGGYNGIEKLVKEQETTYKQRVQTLWGQSVRHYFTWPMMLFAVVALLLSLQLPNVKVVHISMMLMCILLALSPLAYAYTVMPDALRKLKGKKSILKDHFVTKAATPSMFMNMVIYLPQTFALWSQKSDNWRLFNHLIPPISILIVMAFVVLNLATIRFCREFLAKSLIIT